MKLKCQAGHEWIVPLPPWWAAWKSEHINCPECGREPYSFMVASPDVRIGGQCPCGEDH